MDETEKLWSTDAAQEIRQLVLSGYKRGAAVMRTEKIGDAGFQTKTFGTYGPKSFANISGLDDVLAGRCITQLMTRSKIKQVMNARLMTKDRRDKWQDIRNQSYLLVYRHWLRLSDIIEKNADTEIVEGVNGRPLELWGPIFCLAELFEENGCIDLKEKMTGLALKMVDEVTEAFKDSASGQLIRALKMLMMQEDMQFQQGYYRFQDLIPEMALQATFAEEGFEEDKETGVEKATVKVRKPRWLTPNYVTRQLRLLGFSDFKGSGSSRQVYLTKDGLVDVWERYMGEWEDPEPPFNPQTMLTDSGQSPILDSSANSAAEEQCQPSARAKSLNEDVLIMILESGKSYTYGSLKDNVKEFGYDIEEFDDVFVKLKMNPNLKECGTTPVYYKWEGGTMGIKEAKLEDE